MEIPVQYLLLSNDARLEGFELARLNKAAELRKEIRHLEAEELREMLAAEVAKWFKDNRTELLRMAASREPDFVRGFPEDTGCEPRAQRGPVVANCSDEQGARTAA